jgi:5-methylcytosine-specific restriction enzyme A
MIPFYKDKRWIKKRANVLKRDDYLCRECKRYGKTTPATTVHHIFPLKDYPEHKLNSDNLYSCCNTCHNTFHDRDSNELTVVGMKILERFKNKILK